MKTTEGIPLDFRTCSAPSIKTEREGVFQNGNVIGHFFDVGQDGNDFTLHSQYWGDCFKL